MNIQEIIDNSGGAKFEGHFSKVYPYGERQVVILTTCGVKKLNADGYFPLSNFLPKITRVSGDAYLMPKYKILGLSNKVSIRDKKLLHNLRLVWREFTEGTLEEFEEVVNKHVSQKHVAQTLCEIAATICDKLEIDRIGFECPSHNLALGQKNRLVFLDLFYNPFKVFHPENRKFQF